MIVTKGYGSRLIITRGYGVSESEHWTETIDENSLISLAIDEESKIC